MEEEEVEVEVEDEVGMGLTVAGHQHSTPTPSNVFQEQESPPTSWATLQRPHSDSTSWTARWNPQSELARPSTTTATPEELFSGEEFIQASNNRRIRRVEDASGLSGALQRDLSREKGTHEDDDNDVLGRANSCVLGPMPPLPFIDFERARSEDSYTERREKYFLWMESRSGNYGGSREGRGRGGQELPLASRLRVVGDYQGSLNNYTTSGSSAMTTATTMTTMNDCFEFSNHFVCGKLPDHLIESVLARLPVQSIFRFRTVCRAWNALLHSPTFLSAYLEAGAIRRQNVWFLVVTANLGRSGRFGHRVLATYDPKCNNWLRIPLPTPLCNINPYPTAADGGLVCYFVYENRLRTLFVCNPLTKSLRKLPLVSKTSSHISVLKMVMEDRATSSYKVFVAGMEQGENGNESLRMEVYDSLSDTWIPSGIIPARYPKRRPVYGDGVLYLRCSDQRSLVLAYDLRAGVWAKLHAPLPHTLGIEELVYYQGHVLLVGTLGENYKIDSVCVWELVRQSGDNVAWKQVDSMPRDMFSDFFCDREHFECDADERVLMKCCQYGDLILCVAFSVGRRGPFKVLAYDLGQKRWRKLPDSFQAQECRTHRFIEGIIYEPRLDVVA